MKLFLKNSLLFLCLCLSINAFANVDRTVDYSPYPNPLPGYVSDHANLLNKKTKEMIEQMLWKVESKSQVEIIIVTINSISHYAGTENSSIESFATALFNGYGVGNVPNNDGILLLVARDDRKARIELGAFYQGKRDNDAYEIMQEVIIPQFKKGDYSKGIEQGSIAIVETFTDINIGFPWFLIAMVVGVIASILIGISLIKNGKKGWGWVFIGFGIILALLAIYIFIMILRASSRNSANSNSDTWSSGGLGGFGGGSSGGGGATGSW